MNSHWLRWFAVTAAMAVCLVTVVGAALAVDPPNHGISFTKGCASPTAIGAAYSCTWSIRNSVDDAQDTLTINGLVDVVHSAGGDVSSGNVFSQLRFVIDAGSPTCVGGTGDGSAGQPLRAGRRPASCRSVRA